ncbi:MAG: leucyl/phenylalanyl-tRNA--protein transferase [Pseudomonadota bacterium]
MSRPQATPIQISPELVLKAYACGLFPMAESADDQGLHWIEPDMRGIIPLDGFHVPRRLVRTVKSGKFDVRVDLAFSQVMRECAAPQPGRESTWINRTILDLYAQLHAMGHAHSVEVWAEGALVGGLYGVRINGAFFGESMFSRVADASKVALVHLVARLKLGGFSLLDTQFITGHLARFGAIEVPADSYRHVLDAAIGQKANFFPEKLAAQTLPLGTDRALCTDHDGGGTTSDVCLQVLSQIS